MHYVNDPGRILILDNNIDKEYFFHPYRVINCEIVEIEGYKNKFFHRLIYNRVINEIYKKYKMDEEELPDFIERFGLECTSIECNTCLCVLGPPQNVVIEDYKGE